VDQPYWDESSAESEKLLGQMANSREFWKTFLIFMSQESVNESSELFNATAFLFYKRIFSRFGLNPLVIAFEYIQLNVLAIEDKSKQRAAAEFLAGVIRGSKHWTVKSREKMWEIIIPLINMGIQSCTTDSARYWGEFVRISCVIFHILNCRGNWILDV
jgi:proteasome activator subunit 4